MNDNLQKNYDISNNESQTEEVLQNEISTFGARILTPPEETAYAANERMSNTILENSIAVAKEVLSQFNQTDGQIQQILSHCKQAQGFDGATYIPKVSADGYLSWACTDSDMQLPQRIKIVGERGATGATGAKGADGKDGINGANGKDGINGVTPNISMTATATEDSAPRVVKSGSVTNPNFQLYIPKGEKGEKGDNGEDLKIDGTCATVSQLPTGKQNGTIYMVGGNGLYTMYIYETLKNQWTNIGQLKGEKGEKGENGVNGTNGADGVTPNITLSAISTSSTTPSVNRTGTFPNFNYQLSIPKGAKGDSGTNGTTPNISMTAVSTTSSTPSVTKGGTTANPTFQLSIPKGTDGVTPNITLKAENAAGTTPSVTKGGTTANPIFTLAIPKGEKGEKGVKGDKGDPGGSESKAVFVGNVDFVVDNNPNNNVEIDLFSELDNVSGSEITSTLLISIAGEMGTLTFMHDLDYSQTITYGDLGSQIFAEFIEPSRAIVKVWSFSSQHITQIIVKCL